MAVITITKSDVSKKLTAESTNAARTNVRQDGVSEFESIVIDEQVFDSLTGSWVEATAKLTEKMHEFITGSTIDENEAAYTFAGNVPDEAEDNMLMYIVDFIMSDWLASVRPEYAKRYEARREVQLDDLLRKLYKKEPPV